jgi:hypothetical protein
MANFHDAQLVCGRYSKGIFISMMIAEVMLSACSQLCWLWSSFFVRLHATSHPPAAIIPNTGVLNEERVKHGKGVYQWKKPGEDGEEPVVAATYDGDYWNGKRQGKGKMTYPNGDIYQVCAWVCMGAWIVRRRLPRSGCRTSLHHPLSRRHHDATQFCPSCPFFHMRIADMVAASFTMGQALSLTYPAPLALSTGRVPGRQAARRGHLHLQEDREFIQQETDRATNIHLHTIPTLDWLERTPEKAHSHHESV